MMPAEDPTPQPSSDSPVVDFSPLDTPESRDRLLADVQSRHFRNDDTTGWPDTSPAARTAFGDGR